jgi:hypothetical protein
MANVKKYIENEAKKPWEAKRRWENNIKLDLQEIWYYLSQDRDQLRPAMITVMGIWVP